MDQGYLPGDELIELYNKNSPTLLILKQVKHGPLYNIILTIVNSIMVEFLNWKTFVLYAHFSFPTIFVFNTKNFVIERWIEVYYWIAISSVTGLPWTL